MRISLCASHYHHLTNPGIDFTLYKSCDQSTRYAVEFEKPEDFKPFSLLFSKLANTEGADVTFGWWSYHVQTTRMPETWIGELLQVAMSAGMTVRVTNPDYVAPQVESS